MIRRPTPKLLIFDVDGTLRRTTVEGLPCPNRSDQWELMPNVSETLGRIDWGPRGVRLGVASNQGGVALGYIREEIARSLIEDAVKAAIGFIPPDALIKMCICAPGSACACRKPNPGMLLDILHESGVKRK
ncbi:MAG TPA: HAD-IIIA family hydrolase, partial [Blastocatellia bacterium]|nr:HAD-IIIA family hydrolase [Blastocatellia bacterium]